MTPGRPTPRVVIVEHPCVSAVGAGSERIWDLFEYDRANAIKFAIYRLRPNGSAGDGDICWEGPWPSGAEVKRPALPAGLVNTLGCYG